MASAAETTMREQIAEALFAQECSDELELDSTSSYEEAGVMTMNEGLVVRMRDGSEFQVTVVQSREGDPE